MLQLIEATVDNAPDMMSIFSSFVNDETIESPLTDTKHHAASVRHQDYLLNLVQI